jgi:hypothetical protein
MLSQACPKPHFGTYDRGKFISPADRNPEYFSIITAGAAFA